MSGVADLKHLSEYKGYVYAPNLHSTVYNTVEHLLPSRPIVGLSLVLDSFQNLPVHRGQCQVPQRIDRLATLLLL